MDHQQNRRRAVEAGGGGQNHPPPQPCPRCNSNNTKFCYYNNYSLSQPRFFCKGCRRYWTHGGTLRNVPVGGGCRKSKRPKLASTSTAENSSSTGGHCQLQSLPSPPPPSTSLLNHQQVILNAQDHRLSMIGNHSNNNNISSSTSGVVGAGTMMMGQGFYGGGNPGFLSSLAAMQQGVNQHQLSFGPNLGLLPGFGLPGFNTNNNQPQQNQNDSIQTMYSSSTREVGSSSTPTIQEWNLRMGPGLGPGPRPVQIVDDTSNGIDNNDRDHDRDQSGNIDDDSQTNQQWSNFMGTSGLDDEP